MVMSNDDFLHHVALKARYRAFFVASAMEIYQQAKNESDEQLAAWLGCSLPQLRTLALCQRPDDAAPTFQNDIRAIAALTQVDPLRLLQLLRNADSISALRDAPSGTGNSPQLRQAARESGKRKVRTDQDPPEGNS